MHTAPHRYAGFTARVAREVVAIDIGDLAPNVVERARHAVLDVIGTAVAGAAEPSARIAQAVAVSEACQPVATIVGTTRRTSAREAALANGVAAHALDFDDSSVWAGGHPSAPIVFATLALAEAAGFSLRQAIEAIIAGTQGQARIALATGDSPYEKGFHGTGTFGTFGAAGACARLLRLDAEALGQAYGLAATQAAGLKASFGTMAKHLNAAKAAVNGMLAAQLAANGFTASSDAIEARQGFAWTQSTSFDPDRPYDVMGERLAVETIIFKRHACCHLAHSAIEGIQHLRTMHAITPNQVRHVRLTVPASLIDVCGIAEPTTSLEAKFSVRYAAALALSGMSTGPHSFTDELVSDPSLTALRERIHVLPRTDRLASAATLVEVDLAAGVLVSAEVDVLQPTTDAELEPQWLSLTAKFRDLAEPVIGPQNASELIAHLTRPEAACTVPDFLALARPQGAGDTL